MFKIVPAPTFSAVLQLSVPGQAKRAACEFHFRHQTAKACAQWLAAPRTDPSIDDTVLLDRVIVGWGVVGADGQPLDYSAGALRELLDNYPASGREILDGYLEALTESREKN